MIYCRFGRALLTLAMLQLLFTAVILDQEMHAELGTECLSFLRAGSEIRSLYQATMSLILKKKVCPKRLQRISGLPWICCAKARSGWRP